MAKKRFATILYDNPRKSATGKAGTSHLQIFLLLIVILFLSIITLIVFVLLLSLFLVLRHLDLFEWCVWVDTELFGHQAVHAVDECRWVSNFITRLDECSLEQHL